MSSNVPINQANITAPTPQNTPLNQAPIANLSHLSRPSVPAVIAEDDEMDPVAPEVKAAMLDLVKGRLANLVGKSSGYIEGLPVEVKRSIEGLKGVQLKQHQLYNQYKRECFELEKKYFGLPNALCDHRNAIIAGTARPTPEEIEAGEKLSLEDDEDYVPLPKDSADTAAIPEFWLTALRNHPGLSKLITDRDAGALKYLTDIRLDYALDDGKLGYKIIFVFSENEFFENATLEKTYVYQDDTDYLGDFIYERAIGTDIKWKTDKDLTKEFEIKKQRNKNTNRTRMVRKARAVESFFNFFAPLQPPSEEAIENSDIDDDELEAIDEKIFEDYQIGEDIKERIFWRVVDWFTGKALADYPESESDPGESEEASDKASSDSDGEEPRLLAKNPSGEECKQQ